MVAADWLHAVGGDSITDERGMEMTNPTMTLEGAGMANAFAANDSGSLVILE